MNESQLDDVNRSDTSRSICMCFCCGWLGGWMDEKQNISNTFIGNQLIRWFNVSYQQRETSNITCIAIEDTSVDYCKLYWRPSHIVQYECQTKQKSYMFWIYFSSNVYVLYMTSRTTCTHLHKIQLSLLELVFVWDNHYLCTYFINVQIWSKYNRIYGCIRSLKNDNTYAHIENYNSNNSKSSSNLFLFASSIFYSFKWFFLFVAFVHLFFIYLIEVLFFLFSYFLAHWMARSSTSK